MKYRAFAVQLPAQTDEYELAGHAVHAVDPAALYVLGAHVTQQAREEAVHYLPAGHAAQTVVAVALHDVAT